MCAQFSENIKFESKTDFAIIKTIKTCFVFCFFFFFIFLFLNFLKRERERERERERQTEIKKHCSYLFSFKDSFRVKYYVGECERERKKAKVCVTVCTKRRKRIQQKT